MVRPRWLKVPLLWWWRSLPLRVVLTVFVASVLVLVLGGFLLMQQATIGVIKGKTDAAKSRGPAGRQRRPAAAQRGRPDRRGRRGPAADRAGHPVRRPGWRQRAVRGHHPGAGPDHHRGHGGRLQHPGRAGPGGGAEQRPADHPHRGPLHRRDLGARAGRRLHLDPAEHRPLPDLPGLLPRQGGRDPRRAPVRGHLHRGDPGDPADLHRRPGQPAGRDPGPGGPADGGEHRLGQPGRPDARPRPGRPGAAGRLDELHGLGAGEADHHVGRAVGGPAAVRHRRLARAADTADHGADGGRGPVRGPGGLRPGVGAVGRADADRARPFRGACSPTCWRSPGSTPAWPCSAPTWST